MPLPECFTRCSTFLKSDDLTSLTTFMSSV
jgi:hypothetical protein